MTDYDDYEPTVPECALCGREGHDADECPNLNEEPFVPTAEAEPSIRRGI